MTRPGTSSAIASVNTRPCTAVLARIVSTRFSTSPDGHHGDVGEHAGRHHPHLPAGAERVEDSRHHRAGD